MYNGYGTIRDIRIDNVIFDTVKCTAYISQQGMVSAILVSNLSSIGNSTKEWTDEASYGVCTYRCMVDELAELAECIKDLDWRWTKGMGSMDIDYESGKVDYKTRERVMNKLTNLTNLTNC